MYKSGASTMMDLSTKVIRANQRDLGNRVAYLIPPRQRMKLDSKQHQLANNDMTWDVSLSLTATHLETRLASQETRLETGLRWGTSVRDAPREASFPVVPG